MAVLQIVRLRPKSDVSEAELVAVNERFPKEVAPTLPGLERRGASRGADGEWVLAEAALGHRGGGQGNTLRRRSCVHWVNGDPCDWLAAQRAAGSHVVGIELAEEAVRLADLPVATRRTVAVLGHESTGIPAEALDLLDTVVEIPMLGTGDSLNVAVAGSLVLYKLAGLI